METKYHIALLILSLISTGLAAGDVGHHHWGFSDCPPPIPSPSLPFVCTVTDKCSTVACSAKVGGEVLLLTLKIDKSQDPLSADIRLKVAKRNFDWSRTLKSGDNNQVHGFPLTIMGQKGADMFLTLTIAKTARGIAYELDLSLNSQYPFDIDVCLLKGKLPLSKFDDDTNGDHDDDDQDKNNDDDDDDNDDGNDNDDDNDDDDNDDDDHHEGQKHKLWEFTWLKRQTTAVKATISIVVILAVTLLLVGLCYCYKKRRVPSVDAVDDQPPSYDEATTTVKTKVPLQPLANEK